MAWIESHQSIERHPKTLMLMGAMGWDLDTTIGKLHRFWWWCVDYAEDGDLQKHNDTTLGTAVGLNGEECQRFVKAMVEARWLDRQPFFRVHKWWKYIGRFLQVKYKSSPDNWKRVRDAYNHPDNPPNNGSKAHNQPTNQPTKGAALPRGLDSPEFSEEWAKWIAFRRKKRWVADEDYQREWLERLGAIGLPAALATVKASYDNRWQGLFPDKHSKNGTHEPARKPFVGKSQAT